jgi:hypothetical protein
MAEQRQVPENLPIGGSDKPSIKIQAPKEGLEGIKEMLSSVFSKGDKAAHATLGPAAGPVEGLLSLFDLRDIPDALSSTGKDIKTGVTEGDPKALAAGILGTALVGAENVPGGNVPSRAVNRIIRRKNIKNNIDQIPSSPIKIASQKKNKEGLLLDEEDNPVVVYHSTRSSEPFSEFDLKKGRYDFLSTSTQPDVAGRFGLSGDSYYKDEIATTGARLIPGMIKAKKTFDFENVKDTEDILNKFSKTAKKDIKELDDVLSKLKTTNKSSLKIRDYIDPNLLTNDQKQMVIFLHEFDNVPMPKAISQYLELNRGKLTEKLSDIFKKEIKKGKYEAIEDKDFLKVLKQEGYDSFTTFEEGGKNIMLLEPEKQFIPLFDEKKTSTLGYKKGGSVVERNPYNYTARAI